MENKNLKNEVINIMLDELVKRKLIKKNNSIFDDTKQLLKNYNKLKHSKNGILKQIKNLNNCKDKIDLRAEIKSSSLIAETKGTSILSNLDTINQRIIDLEQDIIKIDCFLDFVDNALNELKNNDGYDLIKRVYFNNEDPKDLAIEKNCDETTIYRKINKSLDELKVLIFPSKFVDEIN
jgi:hypothetical protein